MMMNGKLLFMFVMNGQLPAASRDHRRLRLALGRAKAQATGLMELKSDHNASRGHVLFRAKLSKLSRAGSELHRCARRSRCKRHSRRPVAREAKVLVQLLSLRMDHWDPDLRSSKS